MAAFANYPTTKRDWEPGGGWVHGEPLPMPVPVSSTKRWHPRLRTASAPHIRRVGNVVASINRLASATLRGSLHAYNEPPRSCRPTGVQVDMVDSIARRVFEYGEPPGDLSPESALLELCASRDLYSQEPQNLAPYQADKLKVAKGGIVTKSATALLRPEIAGLLSKFRECIERPPAELDQVLSDGSPPVPYWDPVLKSSTEQRHQLFRRLIRLGIFGAHTGIKCKAGVFFVKKKDGSIRMVIDSRLPNLYHRRPPRASLGTAQALAELDLSESSLRMGGGYGPLEFEMRQSSSDVKDAFYQFDIVQLGSWFGIDEELRAGDFEVSQAWDDELQAYVPLGEDDLFYIGVDAMPMGWTWALFFCNEAVTECAAESLPTGDGWKQILRDRQPAPRVQKGKPVQSVYVDNFNSYAGSKTDAVASLAGFDRACRSRDLATHEAAEAVRDHVSLGLQLFGVSRHLRHKSRRVWRFRLATWALLRFAVVFVDAVEVWLGHAVCLCGLLRPALAVLQDIYPFVQKNRHKRACLPRRVREEMHTMANLVLLCEVDLGAEFAKEAYVGDSSDLGYALLYTEVSHAECRNATQWKERWRFQDVEFVEATSPVRSSEVALFAHPSGPEVNQPFDDSFVTAESEAEDGAPPAQARIRSPKPLRQSVRPALPGASLGVQTKYAEWLRDTASRDKTVLQEVCSVKRPIVVETPTAIPEISYDWDPPKRWKTVVEGCWKYPEEHINPKELRVMCMAIRRSCKNRRNLRRKLLVFGDNLVSVMVLEKGRAKSRQLNVHCRRAAAHLIGAQMQLKVRHYPTKRNPADEGSRRVYLGGRRSGVSVNKPPVSSKPAEIASSQLVILELDALVPPPGLGAYVCQNDASLVLRPDELLFPVVSRQLATLSAATGFSARAGRCGPVQSSTSAPSSFDAAPASRTVLCLDELVPLIPPIKRRRPRPRRACASPACKAVGRVERCREKLSHLEGSWESLPPSEISHSRQLSSCLSGQPAVGLELYAGTGVFSAQTRRDGASVLSFEIRDGPMYDLSRESTRQAVLRWIENRLVSFVSLGTPCTVWSIARRGIKNHRKARIKERIAVDHAIFSCQVARLCHSLQIPFMLENPRSSRLWQFDPVVRLLGLDGVDFVDFDMCGYGTPYKKPTRIMSNIPGIQRLARKCCHLSHQSPLVGHRCALAGEYPKSLCRLMSSVLKKCFPNEVFTSANSVLDNLVSELRDVYASRLVGRRGKSEEPGDEHSKAQSRGYDAIRRFNVRFPREP